MLGSFWQFGRKMCTHRKRLRYSYTSICTSPRRIVQFSFYRWRRYYVECCLVGLIFIVATTAVLLLFEYVWCHIDLSFCHMGLLVYFWGKVKLTSRTCIQNENRTQPTEPTSSDPGSRRLPDSDTSCLCSKGQQLTTLYCNKKSSRRLPLVLLQQRRVYVTHTYILHELAIHCLLSDTRRNPVLAQQYTYPFEGGYICICCSPH